MQRQQLLVSNLNKLARLHKHRDLVRIAPTRETTLWEKLWKTLLQ